MKQNHLILSLIALTVFLGACKNNKTTMAQVEQIRTYPVQTLSPQDIELQSVYPTTLKGQEDIDIKPRVDGFIDAVYVDEGALVKKGQPLFKINSPSSVQALENAQANYNTAKLDVERMRPLAEKGIISKVKISTYENTYASAEATLQQARATLGWTTVTSPVNGVVGSITYRLGSLVNNTTILTTVSNTTHIIAYFSMNEKDLYTFLNIWPGNSQAEKIKHMPDVKLILSDGSTYEEAGRIETISGVVDATSGAVSFRASFSNKNGLLRSGTSGKIVVPQKLKNVLVIPQKATFSQQDKILVYKVQGDSVIQKTIKVKPSPDAVNYAVTDGLATGDVIVTDGVVTLKSGKKIKTQSL